MQKNFDLQEIEVTLKGTLLVKENGNYALRCISAKISSNNPRKNSDEAYVVAFCVDTLEEITGVNVGELMRHAIEVENLF